MTESDIAGWSIGQLLWDLHRAKRQGSTSLADRQRTRLSQMVAFARANSPFYREFYKGLPEHIEDAAQLPVTDKKQLMARFDDWSVDREITLACAHAFTAEQNNIGARFLDR